MNGSIRRAGTFRLAPPKFAVMRTAADALGTPSTLGTQLPGKFVETQGWTPNAKVGFAGGWLTIAGRLRQVLQDAYSDESGNAKLVVWPNVTAVAECVVEWLEPYGIFRLDGQAPESVYNQSRFHEAVNFGCVEVLE